MGDRQGQLLTGSVVFNLVDEQKAARDAKAAEKEVHQQKSLITQLSWQSGPNRRKGG
jgi:hypothetical protein